MALENVSYRYKDLKDIFLQWIKNNCKNIDGLDPVVDDSMRQGYRLEQVSRRASSGSGQDAKQGGSKLILTLIDGTAVKEISKKAVEREFNDFMTSRNFNVKDNVLLDTNGILNFWNNVSAFCTTKLIYVSSSLSLNTVLTYSTANDIVPKTITNIDEKELRYNLSANTNIIPLGERIRDAESIIGVYINNTLLMPDKYTISENLNNIILKEVYSSRTSVVVRFFPDSETVEARPVDEMLSELTNLIQNIAKTRTTRYNINNFKDLNTCSSSSSVFIGYMKLGK